MLLFVSREVAAFGRDSCEAFIQALVATGFKLPDTKVRRVLRER